MTLPVSYRNVCLQETMTHSVFCYVAKLHGANCIEIGLGFQTRDGLQRAHIASQYIHGANIAMIAENIELGGVSLKTGKLADHFFGNSKVAFSGETAKKLAQAMRDVHDAVWPEHEY